MSFRLISPIGPFRTASYTDRHNTISLAWVHVPSSGLRTPAGFLFTPTHPPRGVARSSFTARIEGAILSSHQNCFIHPHRKQHPCWSRCARRARLQLTPPSSLVISQGWGLIDLPLCATLLPAHPLARQDGPLSRARDFQSSSLLVKGMAEAALYCAHRTSTVSPCAFCEQEGHLAAPSPSFRGRALREHRGSSGSIPSSAPGARD